MRKEFIYKLAIVGVAAVAAVFALTSTTTESTSLFTVMDSDDHEYMAFVSKHGRNFGTKEEYEFRLKTFKANKARINAYNLS